MKNFKDDYENIKATKEFKQKINFILKKENSRQNILKSGITAAIVLVISSSTLNLFPQIAYALSDIPVLNSVVKVLTFGRFEFKEGGYEADISTPNIEGLLDKELEQKLNEEFKEHSDALILEFEKDVSSLKDEFGDEEVHMGIKAGYEIKTNTEDILAISLYTVNTVGSSSTVHKFYTIDKKTNTLLKLEDLFKDSANYIDLISKYIKEEMQKANEDGAMYWIEGVAEFGGFEKIDKNQSFYINDKNELVICFDKYEVAPGAQGSSEFIIANEIISDILK